MTARKAFTRRNRRRERLDPVRWRRPQRGALARLVLAAALLITSAAVLWYQPTARAPDPADPAAPTPSAQESAASPGIPAGKVGVPVRLADPTALTLVRPGQRVDLLRTGDRSTLVASAALVLEVTGADDPATGGLLLALDPGEADSALAGAGDGFAIVIRPG
ncbi:hypothetical protein AMIS_75350 [Actinoplanes missouriensis 431]|uniref:SAF domain-containing protein n=1 Tax=Actinoplanes missouriensis (strain ATCC 14538 / DSM 43046 / CBS 188.64 / JCM 3121 / NBRC 102363 / NCIMB 12654 / NRRL B-3342 / UNCC 431) TaxID=512565 RepID=I0HIB8_ACTM4|nr:hypothetical protein [Actinoplanes missouriensis]BAL92755.1 hypothetical protein AMIS_75350 [Actinoplanes missouriensis 431]